MENFFTNTKNYAPKPDSIISGLDERRGNGERCTVDTGCTGEGDGQKRRDSSGDVAICSGCNGGSKHHSDPSTGRGSGSHDGHTSGTGGIEHSTITRHRTGRRGDNLAEALHRLTEAASLLDTDALTPWVRIGQTAKEFLPNFTKDLTHFAHALRGKEKFQGTTQPILARFVQGMQIVQWVAAKRCAQDLRVIICQANLIASQEKNNNVRAVNMANDQLR